MDMDKTSPKFKGYNYLPRYLNYDLFSGKLTLDELGLLLVYVMNADWGYKHKYFGMSYLSNNEIGKISKLNRNKVAQLKKCLVEKGYIKKVGIFNGVERIKISNFAKKFQAKNDWKLHAIFRDVDKQI